MLKNLKLLAVGLLIFAVAGCSLRPGYYGKRESIRNMELAETSETQPIAKVESVLAPAPVSAPVPVPEAPKVDEGVSQGLKKLTLGEQLTFSIRWLGLEAGRTTVTIKDKVQVNGHDCYHIEAFSRTTYILDVLFRIRDYHDTYVDAEEFYTHRFLKRALEGDHTYDETNDFDYVQNKAFYVNKKKNQTKVTSIPGKVQDIVSVSYWFRTRDVKVGDAVKTVLHSDEKNYDVTIHVLSKEKFNLDGKGNVPMIVIEPKAKRGEKVFKKGRAKIWVTDDAERLPLFAEMHVIIAGTLNIVLLSKENIYAGGGVAKS